MLLALQRNEFKSCSFDNDSEDESIVEEDPDFKGELLGNEEEFDTEEESIRTKSQTMVLKKKTLFVQECLKLGLKLMY